MKTKIKRSLKIRWIITAAALILAGAGALASRLSVGFSDWYAFNFYPIIVNIFARISGIFPFSLAEIFIYIAIVLAITGLIYYTARLIRKKEGRREFIVSSLSACTAVLACLAMMFVYNCGINYNRSPFSAYSGLKVEKYTREQLYDTLMFVMEKTNALAAETELDENGCCVLPADLYDRARAAMYNIAEKQPSLRSYYPAPKPVISSPLWCYTEIVGTFTFFTMEANYNTCERTDSVGYTLCHELSHMTGFMREDEANFIAYLACRESGDTYLMYSGCHCALKNLLNAYYREVGAEEYTRVYAMMDKRVIRQMEMYSEFWKQYDTPVATVSTTINDTYLKINNQTDGTKSYGRMADLVIAEYLQEQAQR